ncbi:MAG: hypothetical protein AB7O38_20520, partial [Pirellulaceae bacterium]
VAGGVSATAQGGIFGFGGRGGCANGMCGGPAYYHPQPAYMAPPYARTYGSPAIPVQPAPPVGAFAQPPASQRVTAPQPTISPSPSDATASGRVPPMAQQPALPEQQVADQQVVPAQAIVAEAPPEATSETTALAAPGYRSQAAPATSRGRIFRRWSR